MKIIEQSKEIALDLFPTIYGDVGNSYRAFHFAFAFRRNKLLKIGINNPIEPNHKIFKLATKFGVEQFKKYSYPHAEIDCIGKMYGRDHIDRTVKMVVLRISRGGILRNSKPCPSCQKILNAFDLRQVWYSDQLGRICRL